MPRPPYGLYYMKVSRPCLPSLTFHPWLPISCHPQKASGQPTASHLFPSITAIHYRHFPSNTPSSLSILTYRHCELFCWITSNALHNPSGGHLRSIGLPSPSAAQQRFRFSVSPGIVSFTSATCLQQNSSGRSYRQSPTTIGQSAWCPGKSCTLPPYPESLQMELDDSKLGLPPQLVDT